MLASDLFLEVRASRSLNADQVARLERQVFAEGVVSSDTLDMLLLIDSFARRAHPSWERLLSRVIDDLSSRAAKAA